MVDAPDSARPVARRTIEALLRPEVLALTDAVRADLLREGVDVERLEPAYSLRAMRGVFDVVRRHACPELEEAAGYREVGRRFVRGFKQTPIGWIFSRMAPAFGPHLTIETLPRYLSTVRREFPVSVVTEGDARYRLLCPDPGTQGHFMAGAIEGVLETCGVAAYSVQVVPRPQGFELEITWPR